MEEKVHIPDLHGHRGLPSKLLFTDMDKLKEGDVLDIKILGETFAYEIDQILTVLPEETDACTIESGKDYVTLVTCTPYAVNTHRLLVRGHRIPYEEAVQVTADVTVNRAALPGKDADRRKCTFGCNVCSILYLCSGKEKKEISRRRDRNQGG